MTMLMTSEIAESAMPNRDILSYCEVLLPYTPSRMPIIESACVVRGEKHSSKAKKPNTNEKIP